MLFKQRLQCGSGRCIEFKAGDVLNLSFFRPSGDVDRDFQRDTVRQPFQSDSRTFRFLFGNDEHTGRDRQKLDVRRCSPPGSRREIAEFSFAFTFRMSCCGEVAEDMHFIVEEGSRIEIFSFRRQGEGIDGAAEFFEFISTRGEFGADTDPGIVHKTDPLPHFPVAVPAGECHCTGCFIKLNVFRI